MSSSTETIVKPPAALQALSPLAAVQNFRDALLATENDPLEQLLFNLDQRLAQPGAQRNQVIRHFAERYAKPYFNCDLRLAEQAFVLALDIREHPMLLWGYLRDIASPVAKENSSFSTGVDPYDEIRALLNMQPAAFEAYFGSADYVTCSEARSIFSPAAYLVDLLRLIDAHFETSFSRSLEARRPDIYSLALSPDNTFTTITYIQLVIEILSSMIVRNYVKRNNSPQNVPSAFEIISTRTFPFTVPFNYPLEQTRANLEKINFDLVSVAKTLRMTDPLDQLPHPQKHIRELQEMLRMSPQEWDLLATDDFDEDSLKVLYGREHSDNSLVEDLSDVELFMKQTKLSRDEVQELVRQDLSDAEFNIGLSRSFFINDVADSKGYLSIVLQGNEFGISDPTPETDEKKKVNSAELIERFENLTLKKLDRIHKFVRLARKLQWSFTDLDWGLTALGTGPKASTSAREQCLYFDGINDAVVVKSAPEGFYSITSSTLTIEGWVLPRPKRNPESEKDAVLISSYKSNLDQVQPSWSIVLTPDSRLRVSVLTDEAKGTRKEVTSLDALEMGKYAHFYIPVSLSSDSLFLNGVPAVVEVEEREYKLPANPSPPPTDQEKRALLLFGSGSLGEEFHGCLQEVRIWKGTRDPAIIRDSMYERLSGYEDELIGYWPMREAFAGKTMDLSLQGHGGLIGGSIYASIPKWIASDLSLEEPRQLKGMTFGTSEHGNSLTSSSFSMGDEDNPWDPFQIGFWVRLSERADLKKELILMLGADSLPVAAVPDIDKDKLFVIRRSETDFIEVAMKNNLFQASAALNLGKLYYILIQVTTSSVKIQVRGENSSLVTHNIPGSLLATPNFEGCVVAGEGFAGTLQDLKIWTGEGKDARLPFFDATSTQGRLIQGTSQLRAFWTLNSLSGPDDKRISRDSSGNDFHLHLAKLGSNFSPMPKEPIAAVAQPAVALAMDGKSVVQITNTKDMGLGRMREGTLAFWFKPLSLPTTRTQLLFAHGEDDVGITAYLDQNSSVIVTAWSRIYDAKRMKFIRTETVKILSSDQRLVASRDEWHLLAVAFVQDLETEDFQITACMDSTSGQDSVKVSLSPTEPLNFGGLPEMSDGWIAFEDTTLDGTHAEVRPDIYFSGLIMDIRLWNTKLDALNVQKLMSRAPEMGTENNLLLSAPLDSIRDPDTGEHVIMISDQWQKPGAPCSPGEFAVTLHRQKQVITNDGDGPYGSEYLFCTVAGSETWKDYAFRGRIKCSSDSDRAGVVFYSSLQTATDGTEYRDGFALLGTLLPDDSRSFELMSLPSARQIDTHPPGTARLVVPGAGWYRFLVESKKTDDGIEITAKVWMQENTEPESEKLVLASTQPAHGTVGLWSLGIGEKKYDDLMIYKEDLWIPLFKEGFEEAQADRAENWLDIQTHLTPFAPLGPSLPNQCLGFDTFSQESEQVALYLGQPGLLESWTSNRSTKIRGRMMFETDGSEIGLYVGLSKTDGNKLNSLALLRAPFRTTDTRNRTALRNAFVYRLEARHGHRVETMELSQVTPLHSRWYRFEIEISSSRRVGAKVWEDGTAEPATMIIASFANWRPRDNTSLGLMGRLAGKKFYSDIDIATVDSSGVSQISYVPNSVADGDWGGDLTGFGIIQPHNALVGGGVDNGSNVLSLYRSETDDEVRRWENPSGSGSFSFCGRVFLSNRNSSFALIVNCRVPFGENRFYSIQRTKEAPFLHAVEGYGDRVQLVTSSNSKKVVDEPGWHRFKVFVNATEDKVDVSARLWKLVEVEPAENTIEFVDSSPTFLPSGTVGVWSDSADTLFDSLTLNEDLGLDVLLSEKTTWSQYIATKVQHFFGFSWRMQKTEEELFKILIVNARPEVHVTGDSEKRFFSFTDIPRTNSLLVKVQISLDETEAEAGITFSGGSNRLSRYGALIRTGDVGRGRNGMLQITGFGSNGEKLTDQFSFTDLNAATSRHRSNMEITPNVWYNLLIHVGETKSVEGDMLIRISAKAWRVDDYEPSHFAVVGYTRTRFETNEVGLYSAGPEDKLFRLAEISTRTDIVMSGNRAWQGFGWVNAKTASLKNSILQSYHVKESPDDSLLWLRDEDDGPNRAQRFHLDFSGGEQFMTADLSTESWTFQATVIPRGQRAFQPVLTLPSLLLAVWIASASESTVYVQVGQERRGQSYNPQEWTSVTVTVVVDSRESVKVDFHGIATYDLALTDTELPASASPDYLYIGRGKRDESSGEKRIYYDGQMSRVLLLSRAVSSNELHSFRSLTHASIIKREYERGFLQASWPSLTASEQFSFGGPIAHREPQAVTELLRGVTVERSAWASEALSLVFDSQDESSRTSVTVPFDDPNPASLDLRSRTVQVLFRVTDSTKGTQERPQLLYREGQIQFAIAGGKLHYVVGYDSLSDAMQSSSDAVLSVDIGSRQWHAAALTLEAGKYTRPGAVMVYLDGSAVSVAGGSLLSGHKGQECLLGGGSFDGTILSVLVLADVASASDVAAFAENPRLSPDNALLSLYNSSFLPFRDMARVEELSVSRRESTKFESIFMSERLENIAYLANVMKIHDLDASRAVSLVGPLKEVGRKEGSTPLFDLLFNSGFSEDRWSSQMNRVPWSIDGQNISDVVAKIRLVRASGLPKAGFDDLLEYLGTPTAIDGDFLQRLANASGLSRLFGIEPKLLGSFLKVMGVNPMKIGIRDVLIISSRLMWFLSRDVSIDLLLQLLGLDDTGTVSSENISEMVQLNAANVDNYRINAEALQSELLSVMEVDLLMNKLIDVNTGIVSPQTELLSKSYLYGATLESMRLEKSWTDILLRSWLDLFTDHLEARIIELGLQDNVKEFGSLGILVNQLSSIGVLFGPELHEELSSDQLLLALQESKVEGPPLLNTPKVMAVLDLLVEDVIPVWAEKVEDVEKKLLERRTLMDSTTVNGIADLFELDAGTVARVFQIPDFVTVAEVVSALLEHPDEAQEKISRVLQVTRIADAFKMSDVELKAYVESPEVRYHVFGISMSDTLTALGITSVTGLSAYRDVRDYINNVYNALGKSEVDSGTEALVALLRRQPSFDQGDLIAETFSWDVRLTERTLQELSETLGYASTERVDVLSLWYVMSVFKLSSDLSLELRHVKLFGSSSALTWKRFEDLATLSRGSLRSLTSDDADGVEGEIFAAIAPSARDALLGVIESEIDEIRLDPNAGTEESGRKISSDSISLAISDFILLDVQTAPAVLVSRVQQAIQSTQLFINKALLREEENLLKEKSREAVKRQWDAWMRNYRVWEAARRVFLYPENFVEPELRLGTTPGFQQLVDHVSGGGDTDSISAAVSEYVRTTGHVLANLRVAGAGFYHDKNDGSSDVVERLMVVGRMTAAPGDTYVRQRETTKVQTEESSKMPELNSRWGDWEKVDQVVSSQWISPCYAFGNMHLFWVEWQPENSQYYLLREEYIEDLKAIEKDAKTAKGIADAHKHFASFNRFISESIRDVKAKQLEEEEKKDPDSKEAKELRGELDALLEVISHAEKMLSDANKVIDSFNFYESLFTDPKPSDITQAKKQVHYSDQSSQEIRLVRKELMDKEMSSKNGNDLLKAFWGETKFLEQDNRPPFVSVPVLSATIKYVQQSGNGSWTTPQSYPGVETQLLGDIKLRDSDQVIPGDHRKPGWQRLYCMRAAVPQGNADVKATPVKNPAVFDATKSTRGIQIPGVQEVATFECLAKLELLTDITPFSRSLSSINFDDDSLAELEVAGKKDDLESLGFFGPPQADFSISLMSISSGLSAPKGTIRVEPLGTLQPDGIQDAYRLIDEVLTAGSDGASLSQTDFDTALSKFTEENTVLQNDKAKQDLENEFGIPETAIILSTLEAGSNATESDLLKTSAVLKRKATFKSPDLGIYYHGVGRDSSNFQILPDALLGKWSHYVVSFKNGNDKEVIVKARALENAPSPDFDMEVSFPLSESLDGSDTIIVGDKDFSEVRRQRLVCQISEARAWKGGASPPPEEFLFSSEWEGLRISDIDLTKAKDLGLLKHDGLYTLQGPNIGLKRREVIFTDNTGLLLKRSVGASDEFSRERVIIIHNGSVYSIANSSSQAFPVTAPSEPLDSPNIGVVMESQSETSNNPNPTATVYAVKRSSLPPLSPQDSPANLDFYSGSKAFEINPAVISDLQKQITVAESDKIALLGGSSLKWNNATVQPVQNMLGAFIVETGDEIVLITANARSNSDKSRAATKTVSELLRLEQGAEGENSWTLTQLNDPHPPYWEGFKEFGVDGFAVDRFAVERLSAPALHSVMERFARGGPPVLFSEATQTETESPASDPGDTFTTKFVLTSSEKHLEFVRIGAENESFTSSDEELLFFDRIDFMGSNGTYYWELFFHVPMLIADSLNANSQYADSRKWFGYVFDPNGSDAENPWKFLPFRRLHSSAANGDPFVDILGNKQAVSQFRERPFDAHLIASTRNFAYQKSVFVKYVNNLLDEGDSLFIDDRESINESLLSYFLAAKVLGTRPREIPRSRKIRDATFRGIKKLRSKLLESFVIPARPKPEDNNVIDLTALTISFCVPENERLLTLWNRVEDRLYKIRNSLDINGTFRQLDLFSPPIDPAALVAAFAAGSNARDAIQQLNRPVPHYRFDYMLKEAISSVGVTMKLGFQLLSALEKMDAESLKILHADQRRRATQIAEIISGSRLAAARHGRQALEVTYRKIDNEVTRYEGLLQKGKSYTSKWLGIGGSITKGVNTTVVGTVKSENDRALEKKEAAKTKERVERQDRAVKIYLNEKETPARKVSADSGNNQQRSSKLESAKNARQSADLAKRSSVVGAKVGNESAAAAVSAVPDTESGVAGLGALFGLKWGGEQLSRVLEYMGLVLDTTVTIIDISTQIMDLNKEQALTKAGWERSLLVAQMDRLEVDERLGAAVANEEAAVNEEVLAIAEALNAEQTYLYHEQKFSNTDLYLWLSNRLKRMYRNSYQLALQTAKEAERALQFELPTERTFISGNSWSSARNGLLAAEMLRVDLQRMRSYKTEQSSRLLDVERKISMRNELPDAWRDLLDSGECDFEFSEQLFDKDFPGHYFRVLKTVAVTIVTGRDAIFERDNSVRGRLEQLKNRVVMNTNIETVRYLLGLSGASRPNTTDLRSNWRANQAVILSKWVEDTGMHVNYFKDDRYFPFEGTGAVSRWRLSIPPGSNVALAGSGNASGLAELDRNDTDVIFTVKYSSKSEGGPFVADVLSALDEAAAAEEAQS